MIPAVVAHADWSTEPTKRWSCRATRDHSSKPTSYRLQHPEKVGDLFDYLRRLQPADSDGPILAGFDFPIGLPIEYASRAGIARFTDVIEELGCGDWSRFFDVCRSADEIDLYRPFYPFKPGGTSQAQLYGALGFPDMSPLLRHCERKTDTRGPANPLFWTLGGKQVGKAAIKGWQELLQPALRDETLDVRLWPFEGPLEELLESAQIVVAETYPAESGLHLGLTAPGSDWSKTSREGRVAQAETLLLWASRNRIDVAPSLRDDLLDGFGDGKDGEDRFDATVGAMGMLEVCLGGRADMPVLDDDVRRIEGWIFGQA